MAEDTLDSFDGEGKDATNPNDELVTELGYCVSALYILREFMIYHQPPEKLDFAHCTALVSLIYRALENFEEKLEDRLMQLEQLAEASNDR
jgi:hypothetical protein